MNTTTIKTLKHGDGVKMIINGRWRYGTVGTIAGYAAKYGENVEDSIARAKANGHSTGPWINQDCGVLTNDRAANIARVEEMQSRVDLLADEQVIIEGQVGTVKIRGNYSDMAYIAL